ncbi:MAG: hypothetical protein MMC33_006948 [Icmadophila ericetorum]|nr:hypothetical protein [Icmadophila ericetorum]
MFDQNRRDSSHPPQTPLTPHTPFTPPPATNQVHSSSTMDIDSPLPSPQTFPSSSSTFSTRQQTRSFFASRLTRLRTPLHALVSVSTGLSHPRFPPSMLHFYLLTESELDALAHFYHQRTPCAWSLSYPAPVVGRWGRGSGSGSGSGSGTGASSSSSSQRAGLDEKRRRFGRFVGLRGCESPGMLVSGGAEGEGEGDGDVEEEEERLRREMEAWVEERIRRGLEREAEREVWRGKGFGM